MLNKIIPSQCCSSIGFFDSTIDSTNKAAIRYMEHDNECIMLLVKPSTSFFLLYDDNIKQKYGKNEMISIRS